jgi:hypothetical protein
MCISYYPLDTMSQDGCPIVGEERFQKENLPPKSCMQYRYIFTSYHPLGPLYFHTSLWATPQLFYNDHGRSTLPNKLTILNGIVNIFKTHDLHTTPISLHRLDSIMDVAPNSRNSHRHAHSQISGHLPQKRHITSHGTRGRQRDHGPGRNRRHYTTSPNVAATASGTWYYAEGSPPTPCSNRLIDPTSARPHLYHNPNAPATSLPLSGQTGQAAAPFLNRNLVSTAPATGGQAAAPFPIWNVVATAPPTHPCFPGQAAAPFPMWNVVATAPARDPCFPGQAAAPFPNRNVVATAPSTNPGVAGPAAAPFPIWNVVATAPATEPFYAGQAAAPFPNRNVVATAPPTHPCFPGQAAAPFPTWNVVATAPARDPCFAGQAAVPFPNWNVVATAPATNPCVAGPAAAPFPIWNVVATAPSTEPFYAGQTAGSFPNWNVVATAPATHPFFAGEAAAPFVYPNFAATAPPIDPCFAGQAAANLPNGNVVATAPATAGQAAVPFLHPNAVATAPPTDPSFTGQATAPLPNPNFVATAPAPARQAAAPFLYPNFVATAPPTDPSFVGQATAPLPNPNFEATAPATAGQAAAPFVYPNVVATAPPTGPSLAGQATAPLHNRNVVANAPATAGQAASPFVYPNVVATPPAIGPRFAGQATAPLHNRNVVATAPATAGQAAAPFVYPNVVATAPAIDPCSAGQATAPLHNRSVVPTDPATAVEAAAPFVYPNVVPTAPAIDPSFATQATVPLHNRSVVPTDPATAVEAAAPFHTRNNGAIATCPRLPHPSDTSPSFPHAGPSFHDQYVLRRATSTPSYQPPAEPLAYSIPMYDLTAGHTNTPSILHDLTGRTSAPPSFHHSNTSRTAHLLDPRDTAAPPPFDTNETPFVFEEPAPSYFQLPSSEREALMLLGPMAPERLEYIQKIHVVSQHPTKTQVTVARQLDGPHYQAMIAEIKASAFLAIRYYRDDFASNNFLYVCSDHSEEVDRLLKTIDFQQLGSRLLLRKPKQSVRQSFFEDFGICSGQSTTRRGQPFGIAIPSLKPGTKDKIIQDLLVTCSDILRALGSRIFDFKEERLQAFAGKLAPRNIIEAMRLAITDRANLCGIHEDKKNDVDFPAVPVFSQVILLGGKQYRISIIMYSRKSIGDYLERKNTTYGPAVSYVLDQFNNIPAERRSILPRSFPQTNSQSVDCHGLAVFNLPCHMNPSFFVSPLIHFGLMLWEHHSLDFAELISIYRAWAAMPYTTYYFCSAVIMLLQQKRLPVRGLLLGRCLLVLMSQLRQQHLDSKTKIPGYRFPTYRKVVIPERKEWIASTTELIRLSLEASFRQDPLGDKKERAMLYEKTRRAMAKEIPDAGNLISNHLLAILAIVGLVPLWFSDEHTVDAASKAIKFLVAEKGLASGRLAAQRFLDTLCSALKRQFGIDATTRYGENGCCKAFRLGSTEGSDERFSDLAFDKQCVFEVICGKVHIYRLGYNKVVVDGPLIDRWCLDGVCWSMPQLLLHFGQTEKVGFCIPPGLGDRGRKVQVLEWMGAIFPSSYIVTDRRKAAAIAKAMLIL